MGFDGYAKFTATNVFWVLIMKARQFFLMVILLAGSVGLVSASESPTLESRLLQALSRAEKAMDGVHARSDVVFMIRQAARLTSRKAIIELDPGIRDARNNGWAERTEYALWELRDMTLPVMAKTLPVSADKVLPAPKVSLHADQKLVLVFVMIDRATNCKAGYNVYRDVGEPHFDYISAHQLLALMIAQGNGCLNQAAFADAAHPYVQRLYSELVHHKGSLTDLQVERAAFLALAGRSDLIDKRIIDTLLREQRAHGGWEYDMDPVHTSGLAYLLLSAFYVDQFMNKAR